MTQETNARRYVAQDEYILEEIQRRFLAGDRDERIRVLDEAYRAKGLPYKLALVVLEDPDPIVRAWLAMNARDLDFREQTFDADVETFRFSDRDLWERLRSDPDMFVRAALHENPHYPPYEQGPMFAERQFSQLSKLERLALMRNPVLATIGVSDLVLKIFDTSDRSLSITPEERVDLALAFMTNLAVMEASRGHSMRSGIDGYEKYSHEKECERLWALLTTFPSYEVRWYGYRYLSGKDKWKAAAYQATDYAPLRLALLANTSESDQETLRLGIKDEDGGCRQLAREKYFESSAKHSRLWRVVGFLWAALWDLIVLLVVLLLFSRVQTTFERLVVTLLVYIQLTLSGSLAGIARLYQTAMLSFDSEFRRLRAVAGEKISGDQRHAEARQLEDIRRELSKANVKFYIHSTFHLVMWFVVVYNLLSAVLA
jgi:hypothetical protein